MEIDKLVQRQRDFYRTGRTKDTAFRIASLQKLADTIEKYEAEIGEALKADSVSYTHLRYSGPRFSDNIWHRQTNR